MFLLDPRDFCYCCGIYTKDDGGYIVSISSVDSEGVILNSSFNTVRGIYEGVIEITPISDTQTNVRSVLKIDLCGTIKIPKVILEKLPGKFLEEYVKIKESLESIEES